MATFIRALNRDLEMNLITHLIIDIDQNHLFFNLLLLYLKENIDSLKHLKIYILTQNKSQAVNMINYFKPDTVVSYKNFAESFFIANYTGCNVKQLFLENIVLSDYKEKVGLGTVYNVDIEHLLIKCWMGKEFISTLIEFLTKLTMLVNYQCNQLNGFTPLVVAVVRGTTQNVYQILALGADCHVATWNNMLPIEWAIMYRREDMFQLLFTHHYATNQSFDLNLPAFYSKKFLMSSSIQPNKCPDTNAVKPPSPPLFKVNYDLILRLLPDMIKQIYYNQPKCLIRDSRFTSLGSILILLPSYNSVSTLRKLIISELCDFEYEFTIFCLYPHVPNNELDVGIGILSLSTNQVRVILSTFNVDSVFLNDIFFVINMGVRLEKVQSEFSSVNLHRLISNKTITPNQTNYKTLLNQNCNVVFYNLFFKSDSVNLLEDVNDSTVGLSTDSMYHCIFAAKCFKFRSNKISSIFNQMISQPKKDIIDNALKYLKVKQT